jgi:serine/threonine protein kinase
MSQDDTPEPYTASAVLSPSSRLLERRRGKGVELKVLCTSFEKKSGATSSSGDDEMHSNYEVLEVVGQGSLGVVHRAVQRSSGTQVALKVVRTNDEEIVRTCRSEFLLLQRIQHPNIVNVLDFFSIGHGTVLVMSFFDGVSLGTRVPLAKAKRFHDVTARNLLKQLLEALYHLHQHRIVHRDVKPENVLVSRDLMSLQLVDFNISRYLPEGGALSPNCTRAYAAPEVRRGGSPSEASDVWGAGLCLCLMLTGQCDVHGEKVDWSGHAVSEAFQPLLKQMLAVDDTMRPAAMTLLQNTWLRCDDSAAGIRRTASSPTEIQSPMTLKPWSFSRQRSNRSNSCDSTRSSVYTASGADYSGRRFERQRSSSCESTGSAPFASSAETHLIDISMEKIDRLTLAHRIDSDMEKTDQVEKLETKEVPRLTDKKINRKGKGYSQASHFDRVCSVLL